MRCTTEFKNEQDAHDCPVCGVVVCSVCCCKRAFEVTTASVLRICGEWSTQDQHLNETDVCLVRPGSELSESSMRATVHSAHTYSLPPSPPAHCYNESSRIRHPVKASFRASSFSRWVGWGGGGGTDEGVQHVGGRVALRSSPPLRPRPPPPPPPPPSPPPPPPGPPPTRLHADSGSRPR